LPVRQAHPFDRLRMTLSGVEWVRAPSVSRGCVPLKGATSLRQGYGTAGKIAPLPLVAAEPR
jgi:hypothetical protein